MKLRKIISGALVLAMSTSLLVGCGKTAAEPEKSEPVSKVEDTSTKKDEVKEEVAPTVTLTLGYWGSSGEDQAFAKAVQGVLDLYPEVKEVKMQQYPSVMEFYQRLPGEIAAGTAPDIVNITNEQHLQLIQQGLVLPLDEYKLDMSNLSQVAVDVWKSEGKQYGIPTTAAPATFAINDDMFKEAGIASYPETWEDVYEASKILTKGDVIGLCLDIGNIYHPTQYMNSFGGGWKDGKAINSEENIKALEYIFKMFDEGLATTAKNAGKSWDGEVFAAEQCAMSTGGTWYVGAMKASAPDVNFSFIPMPGGNGAKGCTLHSYAYALVKGTENKDLAAKVANYLARSEYQQANAEITGGRPSDTTVMDKFHELNPQLTVLNDYQSTATGFGYPADAQFQAEFLGFLESVIYGDDDITAKEILDTLAEEYGN